MRLFRAHISKVTFFSYQRSSYTRIELEIPLCRQFVFIYQGTIFGMQEQCLAGVIDQQLVPLSGRPPNHQ